jgi:hypothetical protein
MSDLSSKRILRGGRKSVPSLNNGFMRNSGTISLRLYRPVRLRHRLYLPPFTPELALPILQPPPTRYPLLQLRYWMSTRYPMLRLRRMPLPRRYHRPVALHLSSPTRRVLCNTRLHHWLRYPHLQCRASSPLPARIRRLPILHCLPPRSSHMRC